VDSDLISVSNTPQRLDWIWIPHTHHQSHLESSNTVSDQTDQAETFEDKLQQKRQKNKEKLSQKDLMHDFKIREQIE
jgi:hypothetical protein